MVEIKKCQTCPSFELFFLWAVVRGNRSNHCEENGVSSTLLNLKIVLFKLFLKIHSCVHSYILIGMHCDYALVTINHKKTLGWG